MNYGCKCIHLQGMIRFPFLLLLLALCACGAPVPENNESGEDTTWTALPPQLSLVRDTVSPTPVASYRKRIPNDLNEWYFSVSVFETRNRFEFEVRMQYEETEGTDSITIPDLDAEPIIEIRPGSSDYSCIIGFLDRQGQFRELKEVAFRNNRLQMTTLKHYAVTR